MPIIETARAVWPTNLKIAVPFVTVIVLVMAVPVPFPAPVATKTIPDWLLVAPIAVKFVVPTN